MPTTTKTFEWVRLPREVLRDLIAKADEIYSQGRAEYEAAHPEVMSGHYRVDMGEGRWMTPPWGTPAFHSMGITDADGKTSFEPRESEDFFDRLGGDFTAYSLSYGVLASAPAGDIYIHIEFNYSQTSVSVKHHDSRVVDRVMAIIRDAAAVNALPIPEPEPERPRVFIGHGGAPEWQKTERWLRTLGVEVRAYETLPHSGRTIERVLTDALEWANFALLVMTGEDERADQTMQARQNVVHELGLFQGRLGWDQALVMLEDGATEFSNIAGTNQLRFPTGMIDAKHGDVIVALRDRFAGVV